MCVIRAGISGRGRLYFAFILDSALGWTWTGQRKIAWAEFEGADVEQCRSSNKPKMIFLLNSNGEERPFVPPTAAHICSGAVSNLHCSFFIAQWSFCSCWFSLWFQSSRCKWKPQISWTPVFCLYCVPSSGNLKYPQITCCLQSLDA